MKINLISLTICASGLNSEFQSKKHLLMCIGSSSISEYIQIKVHLKYVYCSKCIKNHDFGNTNMTLLLNLVHLYRTSACLKYLYQFPLKLMCRPNPSRSLSQCKNILKQDVHTLSSVKDVLSTDDV